MTAVAESSVETGDSTSSLWTGSLEPLGDRLVRAGLLTADDLQVALSEQSTRQLKLGETLIELGFVDEEELLPLMALHLGVESVRLREGMVDPTVVRMIPRSQSEAMKALALFRVRETLTVAMAEPQDLRVIDEIEQLTGLKVNPVLVLYSTLEKLTPRCYEDDFTVDAVTADIDHDAVEVDAQAIDVRLDDLQAMADGSPVIGLVNYVVVHAVRQGSSSVLARYARGRAAAWQTSSRLALSCRAISTSSNPPSSRHPISLGNMSPSF